MKKEDQADVSAGGRLRQSSVSPPLPHCLSLGGLQTSLTLPCHPGSSLLPLGASPDTRVMGTKEGQGLIWELQPL
jgi:hypothetical protein